MLSRPGESRPFGHPEVKRPISTEKNRFRAPPLVRYSSRHLLNGNEVVAPTKADAAVAKKTGQKLAAYLRKSGGLRLAIKTNSASEELALPPSVVHVLVRLLNEMAQGNEVTLTPHARSSRRRKPPTL
jgi:hypothetical protein